MNKFRALFILFFSLAAHAAASISPEVGRTTAELMGDVVYFQVDNSTRARERLMMLLGKVNAEASRAQAKGDVKALALATSIRQLLQTQVNRAPYDVELYRVVVNNYEDLVLTYRPETSKDQRFMMLDVRYRYLSKVVSETPDGTIATAPLQRTLEDAYADAERVMKPDSVKNVGAYKKWVFLRGRVLDHQRTPLPALANNMTLSIVTELGGTTKPQTASTAH